MSQKISPSICTPQDQPHNTPHHQLHFFHHLDHKNSTQHQNINHACTVHLHRSYIQYSHHYHQDHYSHCYHLHHHPHCYHQHHHHHHMNTNPIPHGAISPSTRLCTPSVSLTIPLSSSTPPSLIFLGTWQELKQLGLWGVSCQANSSDPRKPQSLGISKRPLLNLTYMIYNKKEK